jgi:NitT/TauT family transport system substrate-binding protein
VEALKNDVPYLKSIGDFADLDVSGFVQDGPLRTVFGARGLDYDAARAATANPSSLRGDPALASELWLDGSDSTQTVANPTSLLRAVRDATARGAKVRAAYVPDADLGTRWFADKSVWVKDHQNYLPFGAPAGAHRYLAAHPGGAIVNYEQALGGSV